MVSTRENEILESRFFTLSAFSQMVWLLSRNRCFKITENPLSDAICGRTEAAGDVISGRDVNSIQGYLRVNLEFAKSSSFEENRRQHNNF